MKKLYFFSLVFIMLLAVPAVSQNQRETRWYIGVGGNYNLTYIINQNMYGQSELNEKMTFGWIGNINLGFDFSDNWGFKMEAGYGRMGQKYDGTRNNQSMERDIKLDYILIPVMVKFRAGGKVSKFYAMLGPQLGLLQKANQTYTADGQPAPAFNGIDVSKDDIKDRYTATEFFGRLDLGLELSPGKHLMIDIGISNAFAFTDLNNKEWRLADAEGEYKISHNYYVGLNLGINYKF